MSTENNSDKLYNDSIKILSDLIGFKTISGEDNNSIINYCEKILGDVGASSFKAVSYTHLTLPTNREV